MSLSIIVAMTEQKVIGCENHLPWHLSEDLKRFKRITLGKPVIMGRKTYESIGHPLPRRHNIVLSRNRGFSPDGVTAVGSFQKALDAAGKNGEFFVIGGAEIFKLALPIASRIYLTLVHHPFSGDVYFPDFDIWRDFRVLEQNGPHRDTGSEISYSFLVGERDLWVATK